MPETMSRSRKRKAATAAAKAGGRSAEEDGHSQSCAAAKEERYVPRFGSTKRPRTTSQPARALRSVNNEPIENEDQSHNTPDDATLTDELEVEGLHSERGVDVPPSTAQLQPFSEEETQCHPVTDDCRAPKRETMASNVGNCERDVAAAPEEMQGDSTPQPIPGMSLSQNLQQQHHLHSDSDVTTCEGESVPPDTSPVAILAAHSQHSVHSPTVVDTSCREVELNPTLLEDGMNLDLLDPLECNEEDPVLHDEGLKEIGQVNEPQSKKMLPTNEDTPLITVITSVITSIGDITGTQSIDRLNTAAPLCPSLNDITDEIITTSDAHTRPSSAQAISSIPPPDSNIQQLDTVATTPIVKSTSEYLYPEPSSKKSACDGSTTECGDSSECMETGVEDVVVVGGGNGQLQLTSNSQYSDHIKKAITPVTDELLAVQEMMDLTARDLLESQLLEEATVPSCSPLTTSQKVERGRELPSLHRDPHTSHSGGDVMAVAHGGGHTATGAADGSHILQGLIEELSELNQFVLACKRELEAGRRQRAAWLRTQQSHRGR